MSSLTGGFSFRCEGYSYLLKTIQVNAAQTENPPSTPSGGGKYTFTMPKSKVDVKVELVQSQTTPSSGFYDVQSGAYYYDAVLWAVEQGITAGTSATTFSPDATVTRGQTVTFLYRDLVG